MHALYLACRDPRVPWYAKWLMALIIAYALSPIDLIPDFIPVLGQIDDLVIIPAGVAAVIKLIPQEVMEECRRKATMQPVNTRMKWLVAAIIVSVWALALYIVLRLVWPLLFHA